MLLRTLFFCPSCWEFRSNEFGFLFDKLCLVSGSQIQFAMARPDRPSMRIARTQKKKSNLPNPGAQTTNNAQRVAQFSGSERTVPSQHADARTLASNRAF